MRSHNSKDKEWRTNSHNYVEILLSQLEEWEFPPIFKWIQKTSGLNRQEMLNVFNCGYGMVIVSSANLPFTKIGKLIKK